MLAGLADPVLPVWTRGGGVGPGGASYSWACRQHQSVIGCVEPLSFPKRRHASDPPDISPDLTGLGRGPGAQGPLHWGFMIGSRHAVILFHALLSHTTERL